MNCKNCGNKLDNNSKFCSNCGFENNIQVKSKNTKKPQKKKKKWLWLILVVPILCFFVYGAIALIDMIGAFSNYIGNSSNYDTNKMVAYMNEKYVDDKFTYKTVYGGHLGDNQTKIIVSSEKFPNSEIKVICYNSGECSDNYLGIKYEEQTQAYLKTKLNEKFGNKIYVDYIADDRGCTSNGSSYTTFEEYIANESSYIYFKAIIGYDVNNNTKDITLNKIKDAFSNATILADIFFVDESITYSNYDTYDEFASYIQNNQYNKKLFLIKKDINNYSTIEWYDN